MRRHIATNQIDAWPTVGAQLRDVFGATVDVSDEIRSHSQTLPARHAFWLLLAIHSWVSLLVGFRSRSAVARFWQTKINKGQCAFHAVGIIDRIVAVQVHFLEEGLVSSVFFSTGRVL